MHRLLLLIFLPISLLLTGCLSMSRGIKVDYDIVLESVEGGDSDTTSISGGALFTDKDIHMLTAWSSGSLVFFITNESDEKMKIIWDECLFVRPSGSAVRVIHKGVRLVAKNEHQPPTILLPGKMHTDRLADPSKIFFLNGCWFQSNSGLLPNMVKDQEALELLQAKEGKDCAFILNIRKGQEERDYRFNFRIKEVALKGQLKKDLEKKVKKEVLAD